MLTIRQVEILRLLAEGCTQKEIGEVLAISPSTVRNELYHLSRPTGVYQRLGVNDAFSAIAWCLEHGVSGKPTS